MDAPPQDAYKKVSYINMAVLSDYNLRILLISLHCNKNFSLFTSLFSLLSLSPLPPFQTSVCTYLSPLFSSLFSSLFFSLPLIFTTELSPSSLAVPLPSLLTVYLFFSLTPPSPYLLSHYLSFSSHLH